jgi:carboxypeptidase Taq
MSKFFDEVKWCVSQLVNRIQNRPRPDDGILNIKVDTDKQESFNRMMIEKLGYDFNKGRLDRGVHPMTTCGGRITTNYDNGWYDSFSSAAHESGHALYDFGLNEHHRGTPLGEALSMAVHESQSRFYENHIARSKEFCVYLGQQIWNNYRIDCKSVDALYKAINIVEPSFVRVQADELTYNAHVILRFELEREIFNGMKLEELPKKWNDKMRECFGIVPPTDTLGVLQDCHWGNGLFGYFPTYILGSMIAAQLAEALKNDIPYWPVYFSTGNFKEINAWMTEKIHKHGQRYNTKELIKNATGKELSSRPYIRYLENKFSELYF